MERKFGILFGEVIFHDMKWPQKATLIDGLRAKATRLVSIINGQFKLIWRTNLQLYVDYGLCFNIYFH